MLSDLIDLATYPISDRDSDRYRLVVDQARADLRSVGCAVIRNFVTPSTVAALSGEIVAQKHTTHYSTQVMNPYFHTAVDPDFPDHHPVNTFLERSSGFIPGDSWDPGCLMEHLFRAAEVTAFVRDCLEVSELHCYADPLAGLTANILEPGQQFTWHFDTNDFAVTVLVDKADAGGAFQYVPAIRSGTDEGFDAIQKVLDSGADARDLPGVHTLDLRPGDLQIFRGRHSLHRVERVSPDSTPRHAAIFAYTERPGVIGRLERTQQLFGRVLKAHVEAEEQRVRSDSLLD
jgi:hypothetical protein